MLRREEIEALKDHLDKNEEEKNLKVSRSFLEDVIAFFNFSTDIYEYRNIGTVKEFRVVSELNKPKKPIGVDMCTCPRCNTYNKTVKKRRKTVYKDIVYCWHCGQAMDVDKEDLFGHEGV